MIKKGDILLVHNRFDPIGWLIAWRTKSVWTHSTWILDNKFLIESRSSGVVKTPIKKYLSINKRWIYQTCLVRLKGSRKKEIKRAMSYGLFLRHTRNYFKFIWSLILIGYNTRNRRSYMSCSGFIAHCLAREGVNLHPNKDPFYITPGDIAKSKEVINVSAKELRYY